MPRAKKTPATPPPDDSGANAAAGDAGDDSVDGDKDTAEQRPSQLNQIRAALAETATAPEKAAEPAPSAPAAEAETTGTDWSATPPESPPADTAAPAEADAAATEPAIAPWVPPPTQPPPQPATASGPQLHPSTSLALGIVLVVVGVFFLVIRMTNIDLSANGWPLYVIIPGLTLLVVGFVSLGSGALVPGGIVTLAGLVLAYQSVTNDWASWAYAWVLVAPGGVGLGIFLQGLRERDSRQLRTGRSLMFWAVLFFMIGFVFFESILNISGIDYGIAGRAALPALLIVLGVTLLARTWQRSRNPKT
jgi:hypothetical protein